MTDETSQDKPKAIKGKRLRPSIRAKAKKRDPLEKYEPPIITGTVVEKPHTTQSRADSNESKSNMADDSSRDEAYTDDEPLRATRESSSSQKESEKAFTLPERDWYKIGGRAFYMAIFAMIASLTLSIILTITLIQFFVFVIQENPNEKLEEWINNLADYMKEIFEYLSFKTDEKPFPFNGY